MRSVLWGAKVAGFGALFLFGEMVIASAQPQRTAPREFPRGALRSFEELPASRFRGDLEKLPPTARDRALLWLRNFHFPEQDVDSLHADAEGGICYACQFSLPVTEAEAETVSESPAIGEAAVPISPFPASLEFHSKPGAPNVLYLNFAGEQVSGTAWNSSLGRTVIPALPFSTDGDYTTFSDAEQLVIKRVWQRVAEDYAPFDVDVTTERPASFTTRTAHALITRNTDANGDPNPSTSAGGTAYINVFGSSSYASYRPAWVYHNNLSNSEAHICEATSHEVGHNLGLSHDGKTDGTAYYSGHGSGDTSWGTIMGTGYHRNVSQWSKGEYYLANNTQDDLAVIAAKMAYRADDHGNTSGTATALVISGGTNVMSTTPEDDPTNVNRANKGVLQTSTDVDVFSFVTGNGAMSLTVKPWVMPSNTRGGNLDVRVELYDERGNLVMSHNPASQTYTQIQTNLTEGQYFLYIRNTGAGDPFSSSPTGYTAYASLGQYFISGYLVPSSFVAAPLAELQVTGLTQTGSQPKEFTVTYSDDRGIAVSSMDDNDIRITGPNGYDRTARFVSVDLATDGTPRTATYAAEPPSGSVWTTGDNGVYKLWMQAQQVADIEGAWVEARQLGDFQVSIPTVVYSADLSANPDWTLEGDWAYGTPVYTGAGPSAGYTGSDVIAYNLGGNYPDRLATQYATTALINCSGYSTLRLKFHRWLRLRNGDTALIQVSTNGTSWSDLWQTSQAVNDSSWQELSYSLPDWASGSPALQLRWGLASNNNQNDLGWNLDDVELVGHLNPGAPPANATLTVLVNQATWGDVNPASAIQSVGSSVEITANPAAYYYFVEWSGDASGNVNPLTLVLNTDLVVQAIFGEIVTTNHATPYWWLAANGYTENPEAAAESVGVNGFPLWQSYVAGLNPNDPDSRLEVSLETGANGSTHVLNWNTVTGRVYTVWASPHPLGGFTPVAGAASLPWTIQSFTNVISTESPAMFYRVGVEKGF